jgi:hypothetical protein
VFGCTAVAETAAQVSFELLYCCLHVDSFPWYYTTPGADSV